MIGWISLLVFLGVLLLQFARVHRIDSQWDDEQEAIRYLAPGWTITARFPVPEYKLLLVVFGKDRNRADRVGEIAIGRGDFDSSADEWLRKFQFLRQIDFRDTSISLAQLKALHTSFPDVALQYTLSAFTGGSSQLREAAQVIPTIIVKDPTFDETGLRSLLDDLSALGVGNQVRVLELHGTSVTKDKATECRKKLPTVEIKAIRSSGWLDWALK
jgi:hypothetical protein